MASTRTRAENRRAQPGRDRRRARVAARRADADKGRLVPALPRLAETAGRADRGTGRTARRPRLMHRLRLPLAEALRDLRSCRPGALARPRCRLPARWPAPRRGQRERLAHGEHPAIRAVTIGDQWSLKVILRSGKRIANLARHLFTRNVTDYCSIREIIADDLLHQALTPVP